MRETIKTESGLELHIEKRLVDDSVEVAMSMENERKCVLHWGFRDRFLPQWQLPPQSLWPGDTRVVDKGAVQTPFVRQDGYSEITIKIDRSVAFALITFVLFFPEERRWDNNRGRNYQIEIPGRDGKEGYDQSLGGPELIGIAGEIIEREMSRNSWTLMHRFNLCYDLLDRIGENNPEGLALLFVWMRFSFIRQLDWQRNYNTKPRELGHAMDRLTLKIADRYSREPRERSLIRLIMTTLGPGGDAQRVRDEVLHIMHRHHIKEVSGHFLEEWHQKLHNNATPDDIVICEAFIEFYRGDGDLGRFYRRIEEGGLTKERLEGYERPIRSHPDFIPHLKDALIRDLEHFLGILKEVHAGTDLGIAIHRARYLYDGEMHGLMDFLWHNRNNRDMATTTLVERITEARRRIAPRLAGQQSAVRDLLFLDLALEDSLRGVIERNLDTAFSEDHLVDLVVTGIENICLSNGDEEINLCLAHWRQVRQIPRHEETWTLQVKAALDRLQLALGAGIDRSYRLLQPKAEFLGAAFRAAPWSITLFSEEVLRGRPAFALSVLLKKLDERVRELAHLGDWQVISRGEGTGEVQAVASLKSIQGRSFSYPAVIIADEVGGDEEIPRGVSAIITPSVVDVLSHLAIRARNSGVIFATCYDSDTVKRLRSFRGYLRVKTKPTGEVIFEEVPAEVVAAESGVAPVRAVFPVPPFSGYALKTDGWNERNVGGKSNNLKRIMGKLPEWIHLPASVALPFGIFERVLAGERNRETAVQCDEMIRRLDREPQNLGILTELRSVILNLEEPPELQSSLRTVMEESGLQWPPDWGETWLSIKRVWASKWNDRAYLSRRDNGIPHEALLMAVLIQRVVEAEYSFVIHTVNPLTNGKDEIYAEVVAGLGEALVGNYPGKALSFTCKKGKSDPRVLSFPSKSVGLFGSGLIFRSDSNGEDLMGYAGAGLYDSFMSPSSQKRSLDYTGEVLLKDDRFRRDFLAAIAKIGTAVEQVMEYPQDIEGAYSKGHYSVVQTRPQVGIEGA